MLPSCLWLEKILSVSQRQFCDLKCVFYVLFYCAYLYYTLLWHKQIGGPTVRMKFQTPLRWVSKIQLI
jgi:hypothetical protein